MHSSVYISTHVLPRIFPELVLLVYVHLSYGNIILYLTQSRQINSNKIGSSCFKNR